MSGFIENDPNLESELISSAAIGQRVEELAREIAEDWRGARQLCMLGVLKGACVFMSDLGRALRRAGAPPATYDFIRASTYGQDIKAQGESSRQVHIDGLPPALRGKDVLLVEDILDQGFTLAEIRRQLIEQHGVRRVKLCVLLLKELDAPTEEVRSVRERVLPDYVGFTIPDRWVAGYGLDVKEHYRELPCVAIVNESRFVT